MGESHMSPRCVHCEGLLDRGDHSACAKALRLAEHHRRYPFECPQCHGTKRTQNGTKVVNVSREMTEFEIGLSDIRSMARPIMTNEEQVVPVFVTCALCNGVGRLENEPKAIMGVVRWERQ